MKYSILILITIIALSAPVTQAQADSKANVYDSWFMAMEYNTGSTFYGKDTGGVFMIGMNFSNSYGSIFHFGCRLGALAGNGPECKFRDEYYADLLKLEPGYIYDGRVAGGFAELTTGLNLRVGSGFFGFKLFGGVGIFRGIMHSYTWVTDYSLFFGVSRSWEQEVISYTTPYISFGAGIPLGRGSRFAGPVFQIMILPTPDDFDEDEIVMAMLGFKHAW